MSKVVVVSVHDSAAGGFGRPIFVPSVGVALRSFTDEVNRVGADNQMNQHPDDFVLWELAAFDEESGEFERVDKRVLARGKDVKQNG